MSGWTKSVRAIFAALITTLLALLMHVGAGGAASPIGTGIVFVLVLWAAMILAGRRLGYPALTALLGLGQVLMHVTMGWSAGGHGGAHTGGHAAMTGGAHTGGQAASAGIGTGAHAGHIVPASGSLDLSSAAAALGHAGHGDTSTGMLLAHIVAVAITAVILKRGEDIVLSILQLALGPVIGALQALAEAAGIFAEHPSRSLGDRFRLPHAVASAVIGPNYRRGPPALV
ncbi:hypothetical protein [Brevibacterium atlanticum]|uniref:hypothetical protein n=1 Tax=Brevibacterium atlanticum TaxID=2697563 RepID=UPI0014224C90|nr:hypothetical protein [Brevibacterium atlanticum]